MTLPLHTKRLIVRELTADDLDALAAVFADPAVLWWEPAPYTREQTRVWLDATLRRYREDGCAEYAVVIEATRDLIGDCGIVYREVEGRRLPELGWDLRSDMWGHGYATEAARGVLTHAEDLGLRRVCSLIVPENERSRGVARRLGMTVDRQVVWADQPHDLWALDLP
jgi:[ribosomal protein S5]-alanine N-acetyltransferase